MSSWDQKSEKMKKLLSFWTLFKGTFRDEETFVFLNTFKGFSSKMSQNVQKKLSKKWVEFFGLRGPNGERKWAHFKKTNRYISVFWKKFVFSTCRQPMRLKPSFALFFKGKRLVLIFEFLLLSGVLDLRIPPYYLQICFKGGFLSLFWGDLAAAGGNFWGYIPSFWRENVSFWGSKSFLKWRKVMREP